MFPLDTLIPAIIFCPRRLHRIFLSPRRLSLSHDKMLMSFPSRCSQFLLNRASRANYEPGKYLNGNHDSRLITGCILAYFLTSGRIERSTTILRLCSHESVYRSYASRGAFYLPAPDVNGRIMSTVRHVVHRAPLDAGGRSGGKESDGETREVVDDDDDEEAEVEKEAEGFYMSFAEASSSHHRRRHRRRCSERS